MNDTDFRPGDRLCFQGGHRFAGTIELNSGDSGTSDRRLVVTSYGDGRAVIDGANGSSLRARGCNHIVVRDLNFVGSGRKGGNRQDGVWVLNARCMEIDQVEVSGFRNNGLSADGVCDTRITNVYAHENGAAGLSVGYSKRSKNVYIAHCVARNNPGDPSNLTNHSGNGIVVANAQDVVVEYCEAANNGWDMPRKGNGPVGIWAWNSDRAIIQFCISHDNKSPGDDGGGFDLDGGTTNSILQYNLSYNNDGPGYFLCQFPGATIFKNNIIRYNISHNDGVKNNRRSAIDVYSANSNASDCQIYNNTIYNRYGAAVGFAGLPIPDVVFRNNIFVCSGDVIAGEAQRGRFENNVYWPANGQGLSFDGYESLREWAGATGQETAAGRVVGRHVDPRLVGADAEMPTDPKQLGDMVAYRLHSDSACVNTGIPIRNNGSRDFWGNQVPESERPSVGAFNPPPIRLELPFDADWRFRRGDVEGGELETFDHTSWRLLSLPHDWGIEDLPGTQSPFDPNAISAVEGGFAHGGNRLVPQGIEVANDSHRPERITVTTRIDEAMGIEAARTESAQDIQPGTSAPFSQEAVVKSPSLWSVESPALYTAVVDVHGDRILHDRAGTQFGIRTIAFDAGKGFVLNGKPTLLKGGCAHHDNGPLGAAAYDRAERRRVELLKTNGFNAIRCAHPQSNPISTESYERPHRKVWRGRCLVIIRASTQPGSIALIARAQGLEPAEVVISSMP